MLFVCFLLTISCADDDPGVDSNAFPDVGSQTDTEMDAESETKRPPRAISKTISTPLNVPVEFGLEGRGTGDVYFEVTTLPSNGTLVGTLSGSNPLLSYSPNVNYSGDDTLTFVVSDDTGQTSEATVTIRILADVLPTTDTDGDGLVDIAELNTYGTNPYLADTDGDGFDDFRELVTLGFNARVNNFRFNPLIADTPQVAIEIVSAPDIRVNYTLEDGTSQSVGTSRSVTSSRAVSASTSQSVATSVEETHSANVEIAATVGFEVETGVDGGTTSSASVTATAGYGYENSTTNEQSTTWNREQSRENGLANEANQAFSRENSRAASEGELSVVVAIRNAGHVSYTLNNLFLSASYVRPRSPSPLVPVGNLAFDNSGGGFPEVTLSPGQETGLINFKATGLNLEQISELLTDSRGLVVRPTLYNMLDQDGQSYNFAGTGITSNDAMIMIDYNGNRGLENLTKMVAVNGKPGEFVTMLDALNGILKADIATTTDADGNAFVDSVTGLENSEERNGHWLILHAQQAGNDSVTTQIYTTPEDRARWEARNPNVSNLVSNYDPGQISLTAGDVVHFIYLQDEDQDGLSNRLEYYHRTDPLDFDTDGDQLADGVEVNDGWEIRYRDVFQAEVFKQVFSDPSIADTDGDGLDDFAEVNFAGASPWFSRDPYKVDTDGDGLDDSIDDRQYVDPGFGELLSSEYDDLRLSKLKPIVDLGSPGAILPNGQTQFDVAATFKMPSILEDPNPAAQGLLGYEVVTIRFRDESGKGEFPEPDVGLQDGRPYIIGDILPCTSPFLNAPCNWEVVDINSPFDAPTISTDASFTDYTKIRSEVKSAGTIQVPADVFKYVQYVSVNGHFTRQLVEKTTSPQTDVIEVHLMDTSILNIHAGLARDASTVNGAYSVTTLVNWANGGRLTKWIYDGTRSDYRGFDHQNGQSVGFYALFPLHGDGTVDLSWALSIDGQQLNQTAPLPYNIHGSYSANYETYADVPTAFTKTFDGQNAYVPATTTPSMKLFHFDYNPELNMDVPVRVDPSSGGAVYSLTVPAVAGCHTVNLSVWEHHGARKNPIAFSQAGGSENADRLEICRDEFGIWTATKPVTAPSRQALGYFYNDADITSKGNSRGIHYRTETLSWRVTHGNAATDAYMNVDIKVFIR